MVRSIIARTSILIAAIIVLAIGVAVHEPWWDEAQAWLLARDAPLGDLLTTHLAYEGHPPLWYLILMIPAKLGMPYKTINVISALIAAIGVAILVSLRDVPLLLRAAIPFTFYAAYQYSVVSRSYVLVAPLLFAIAAIYRRRDEHPIRFAVLLALLALVSVHGACLAAAFCALFAIDLGRGRLAASKIALRSLIVSALILAATATLLVVVLWPPPDLLQVVSPARILDLSRHVSITMQALGGNLMPSSGGGLIEIAMAALLLLWLVQRGVALELIVLFAALLPVSAMYFSHWHEGLFFWVFVFVLLLPPRTERTPLLRVAGWTVVGWMLALHCLWTALSLAYDVRANFTGSRDAAAYIRAHGIEKRRLFGAGIRSIELQPYFASNIFSNHQTPQHAAFWDWSRANPWPYAPPGVAPDRRRMSAWFAAQLAARPAYFLAASGFKADGAYAAALYRDPNYRELATFSGGLFWKDRVAERIDFTLFERSPAPAAASARRTTFVR